ncbi:metallophosphoesterase family protein [Bacillus sp. M6-12]|uniref:metallophosphoesterase family protein n=1 Tax=Bacillus sp. M6-12 TaxID=2054166 RepID=UPI002155276D|nr:metallophosphoesterase family protein [Bacillus sp. M6-12]
MIYITGDVHGAIDLGKRLNTKNFPEQKQMTKNDYVIIAGDFGFPWNMDKEDQFWLKWLDKTKPFTTLFIDGNHENHDLLDSYPVEMWNGGKVHKINDSVIHLMRGQVFELEGKRIFTFGGADSHDKAHRKEGINWWKREMPSNEEYEEGLKNLEKVNYEVDTIITHTCSSTSLDYLRGRFKIAVDRIDDTHAYFYQLEQKVSYSEWFFGHFHEDCELPNKQILLYNHIRQFTEKESIIISDGEKRERHGKKI